MRLNIFVVIGLIVGLLGAVFGIAAAAAEEPIMGVIVGAVIISVFGSVYFTFFRPFIVQNKLMKHGTPASAKILKVFDTGVSINNNPQVGLLLEITHPTQMPYTAEAKVLVSRLNPGLYQEGMVIPVKIDLNDKKKVAVDTSGETMKADPVTVKNMEEMLRKIDAENLIISESGTEARAIVLKYTPMGINVNGNNPAVTLELEVLPDDRRSFKAVAKGVVAEQSVTKFMPGEEIYVKYDPYDTSKVTILRS